MSWVPLRDDFDLMESSQTAIVALSERIDDAASRSNHEDACMCEAGIEVCGRGWLPGGAPSEYVIAWLVREGFISFDKVRMAAAPNSSAVDR